MPDQQPKYQPSFMTQEEVDAEVQSAITDVATVLAWSRTSSMRLLRYFAWSPSLVNEKYFEDTERVLKQSGVRNMDDKFTISDAEEVCTICWDRVPSGRAASLACGHACCMACWRDHLKYHLEQTGTDCIAVRCPMKECPQYSGETAVEQVFGATSPEMRRYKMFLIRSFTQGHKQYRECPAAGCEWIAKYPTPITEKPAVVSCRCGYRYCFKCGSEDHMPASCEAMQKWLQKETSEAGSATWVMANTKPCPGKNCRQTIEKNGGCNHMTCSQCRCEWCWVCGGPWSEHGSSYYTCNRYKEGKPPRDLAREAIRTELERYTHYYIRYNNHQNSRKLDTAMMARVRGRIDAEMRSRQQQSMGDLDYLEEAAKMLTQCRHVLMYTYAYAYYLLDGPNKELFEFNQSRLEYYTEQLSGFVEDLGLVSKKQDVVNHTAVAKTMLKHLQDGVLRVK